MNSTVIQYRIPASILLCGEYFITHPNNSAICMALDRYASLRIHIKSSHATQHLPSPQHILHHHVRIESMYENTTQEWTSLHECPLLSYAYTLYEQYCTRYHAESTPLSSEEWTTRICNVHALFDTRAFFNVYSHSHHSRSSAHSKLGLGSSEAMAVLSCVFLLILSNIDPLSCITVLAEHARETHTRWQDNRGSGYGIYTSIFGGLGRYTTTHIPSWEALHSPNNIRWFFLKQDIHIASSHAIKSFQEWCRHHPHDAKKISMDMQTHVHRYPNNDDSELLFIWLQVAKTLGLTLGMAIGVSAEIHASTEHILWKAVGAGNECAVGGAVKSTVDSTRILSASNVFSVEVGEGLQCETL